MKRSVNKIHLWYNEYMDELILGKWIEVPYLFFFKRYRYRVQVMGNYITLASPTSLNQNCVLIDSWENNDESSKFG